MCPCVCACVRACVCVCVCACTRVHVRAFYADTRVDMSLWRTVTSTHPPTHHLHDAFDLCRCTGVVVKP